MSEYLSKEEIKQWRSSLEKITLEEFAARLGKKVEEKKETNDLIDIVLHGKPVVSNEPEWNAKAERLSTIADRAYEKEKEIYRAIFYQRTATVTMIDEAKAVKKNAGVVKENGVPQVPMLLFISDGSGGTGFTKEKWRGIPKEYILNCNNASYIELDCPHYIHDYEYQRISKEIRSFIR